MEKITLNLNRPTTVKELLDCFVNGEPVVVTSGNNTTYGQIVLIERWVTEDDSGLSFCLHMSEYDVLGKDTCDSRECYVHFEE